MAKADRIVRPALLGALLIAASIEQGCVSRRSYDALDTRYDKLDEERAALEARVARLELERKNFEEQYVAAQESYEDEREVRDSLETNLKKVQRQATQLDATLEAERLARMEAAAALAKREAELARIQSTYDGLVRDLEAEVSAGEIEIERLRGGLRLNVSDDVLFASGSAELDAKGRRVLLKVAKQLARLKDVIQVRGHTDDRKIGGALLERYPTNWELAGARAARVVRLLEERGVDPKRLAAVSLGPNEPVVANDSEKHRARNRRIEILLVPRPREANPEA